MSTVSEPARPRSVAVSTEAELSRSSRSALRSAAASEAMLPRLRPAPGTSVTEAPGGSAASGAVGDRFDVVGSLGPQARGQQPVATGPGRPRRPGGPGPSDLGQRRRRATPVVGDRSSSTKPRGGSADPAVAADRGRCGHCGDPDSRSRSRRRRGQKQPLPVRAPARDRRTDGGAPVGPLRPRPRGPDPATPDPVPSGSEETTAVGSVMGAMVDPSSTSSAPVGCRTGLATPGRTESRSNSHGRRSGSEPSVSSSDPRATRSSPNMAGSNSSSWAIQSASSSRHDGEAIPDPDPSPPVSRARTAGTWPVGGSVQWGSSVVAVVAPGTAV